MKKIFSKKRQTKTTEKTFAFSGVFRITKMKGGKL